MRFRQLLATQAQIEVEAPEIPGYFKTETGQQLEHILGYAQRGRVVVAAMGAGLGKSTTARQFAACYPHVFIATMAPSSAGVNNMQQEVLEALGDAGANGTPQRLSRRIKDRVKGMAKPLLILDEAQHLSEKSIEEIRSWHDAIGVGIALFGNESVLQRLEGGARRAAFAQLFSRVSMRVTRSQPLRGDIDALAAAWRIEDDRLIDYIRKIAMLPGALRNATFALELAVMIAGSEGQQLNVGHLQDAWAQLSSRPVAA